MTTETGNAFAAAAAAEAARQQQAAPPAATAEDRLIDRPSSLEARLFGGEKLPSLFNKTHGLGVKVTGVIKDAPFEVQSRTYNAEGPGQLRFWSPEGKPVTDATDPLTRQPNRPIMDIVVPLRTDYRFNEAELKARDEDEDDGTRGLYLSSEDLKAYKAAIRKAKVKDMASLVGMRITMWRSGQKPTGKGNPAWLYEAELTRD